MPEQLFSAGLGPTAKRTDGLFFAVYPDAAAAERIAALAQELRREHGLKGKPHVASRLHVTLHHLGNHVGLPPLLVSAANEAAAEVAAAPFVVGFDRVASFKRAVRLPFVLRGGDGVEALLAFQQLLGAALKKAGLGPWVHPQFIPHLTLLYDNRCVAEQRVDPIVWTVREFVLVRSLLGRSQHVPLARWALTG
jgi:2'-5' RNA ligase